MSGERCYTTRTWQRLSWIESWSVAALSSSMDPREEPVILTWNSSCLRSRNGSEFPELPAQNFRNPHYPLERGKSYAQMDCCCFCGPERPFAQCSHVCLSHWQVPALLVQIEIEGRSRSPPCSTAGFSIAPQSATRYLRHRPNPAEDVNVVGRGTP